MSNTYRLSLVAAAIAAAGICSSVHALGVQPASNASLTFNVTAQDRGTRTASGRYDSEGIARMLATPDFTARVAKPEAMAREFLRARSADLGLADTNAKTLVRTSLRQGTHFSVVRFQQTVDGVPVYGSDIAVSVMPNGKIIYVANAAVTHLGSIAKSAAKTTADATSAAKQFLGVTATQLEQAQKMAFATPSGTRLVYKVDVVPSSGPRGDWEVLVDAETGEVLRSEDKASYENGTGTIHTPDPLSYARATYGTTGYVDGNNADTTQLTAALVPVTLDDITLTGSNYSLAGPLAVCEDFDTPHDAGCPSQASTDFSVTRSAMTFDAVMGYWHIGNYLTYVNTTLGVPAMPIHHAGGVHFDPHGFDGDDNSQFISSSEKLTFGQGGVDDAQDADVLIHELGHAIHYFITNGHLSQVEGLSEGIGDYNGAAWSRDFPNQWTPADTAYYWIYSWDGHNSFWQGRVLNYELNHTYAQARGQEIHTAGQYWSSCNLVARDILGGQVMDKAYFEGISMTGGSTGQDDAAQAIVNAAVALGYSNAQIQTLVTTYNSGNAGGTAGCSYAITPPTGGVPVISVDPTTLTGTAAVGASTTTNLAIGNTGSADLTWTIDISDDSACATPTTHDWIAVAPASGSVAVGAAAASVTVTLDATTISTPGTLTTNACVHSNDATTPVVAVPVTFTVEGPDDTIFKDGFDGASAGGNIVTGAIDADVPATIDGIYINWLSGETCTTGCDGGDWHFNPYFNSTGFSFYWSGGVYGEGVALTADGADWPVLASGDSIGPDSIYSGATGSSPDWLADADGYLGFQFDCSSLGVAPPGLCYGYVHMTSTAPTGDPAHVAEYAYDASGAAITIP